MADIELLPMPEIDRCDYVGGTYPMESCPSGEYVDHDDHVAAMQSYARINVEYHTERLRHEVETLRDGLDYLAIMKGVKDVLDLRAKAARAEQSEEAFITLKDLMKECQDDCADSNNKLRQVLKEATQWAEDRLEGSLAIYPAWMDQAYGLLAPVRRQQ